MVLFSAWNSYTDYNFYRADLHLLANSSTALQAANTVGRHPVVHPAARLATLLATSASSSKLSKRNSLSGSTTPTTPVYKALRSVQLNRWIVSARHGAFSGRSQRILCAWLSTMS